VALKLLKGDDPELWLIEYAILRGTPADGFLTSLAEAAEGLGNMHSGSPWFVAYWRAKAKRLKGEYELMSGRDPRGSIAASIEAIVAFQGEDTKDPWFLEELVEYRYLEAEYKRRQGEDPEVLLQKARAAAGKVEGKRNTLRKLSAQVEIASIRFRMAQGKTKEPTFEAALTLVRLVLEEVGWIDPRPAMIATEIYGLRATWRADKGQEPGDDVKDGLRMVDRALATAFCKNSITPAPWCRS